MLPKIKHVNNNSNTFKPDQAIKLNANHTGAAGLQIPQIELRGQYRNQLRGSYVRRAVNKGNFLNEVSNKPQSSLRGSYGTFGQARRDLSPLDE